MTTPNLDTKARRAWRAAFRVRTGLVCMMLPGFPRYVIDRYGYGVEFCETQQ